MKQVNLYDENSQSISYSIGNITYIVDAHFQDESECLYQKIVNLLVDDVDECEEI